ncbi:MAG: dicarboxylate/amino acid:cation symporter [Clostridia bacterium]|nr:dicarboxylate/amino acid:cation symporter [Clostridia bacterium]
MKKFFSSLPARLLMGIVAGILLGLVLGEGAMSVVVSLHNVLGQVIMFCVPLVVIAFIAPSITSLGKNASRMLTVAVALAYVSTVGACLMSMGVGYALIPKLAIAADATVKTLPPDIFGLTIPQIMPVMSALAFALLIGLGAVWAKTDTIAKLLDEFRALVLKLIEKVVIPLLPVYICLTFCELSWDGTVTKQLPAFLQIIAIVIALHFVWMAVLYAVAGVYSGRSAKEVFRHYGPAYLTAVGTMSSAATLSVALDCAHKSKVLREDMVDFGVPLFANIHLCGSALTETFFCMAVSLMLTGKLPSVGTMLLFIALLGIFAVGAPGVPGGTVMASMGILISVLGFDGTGTALVLAIFALQDSFGTACNVTGDGALTLMLTGFAEKKGIR